MSQASQMAPPPPATAPAPQTVVPAGQAVAPVAAPTPTPVVADTPRRLRLLTVVMIAIGVIVGLVSALTLAYLAYSLNRAEADAAQLIRVQKIETNLLSADATATNAFLVGGLEPPAQRASYDQAMVTTSTLIAQAAQAQPADSEALAALNTELVNYASAIEQARANNRQGLPVGAQYLRNASTQLRAAALPILDNLVASNAARADDEMDLRLGYVAVAVQLLGLAGAVIIQVWVARRFRRRINLGLLLASATLLVALATTLIGLQALNGSVTTIKNTSFRDLNVAADVRIDANNAKSNESLTLIARGSGQAFEDAWKTADDDVTKNLSYLTSAPNLAADWRAYSAVHTEIRKLDDAGSWDRAVAKATGQSDDSANATFGTFDTALAGYIDKVSDTTSVDLRREQPGLVIGAILSLLAGLAAALLGRAGLAARLREYR